MELTWKIFNRILNVQVIVTSDWTLKAIYFPNIDTFIMNMNDKLHDSAQISSSFEEVLKKG